MPRRSPGPLLVALLLTALVSLVVPTRALAVGFASAPAPTLQGTPVVGQTLTAVVPAWTPARAATSYQWFRLYSDGVYDAIYVDGSGYATGASYVVQPTDVGTRLYVAVTGTAPGGYWSKVDSAPTAAVQAGGWASTGTVTIAGVAAVGQSLTAQTSGWAPQPTEVQWQWYRVRGGASTPIPNATSATYLAVAEDAGAQLTATAEPVLPGYPVTQRSATTGVVAPQAAGAGAGLFTAVTPARLLDTRDGTGGSYRIPAFTAVRLQVAGRGGVPVGAGAAVLNVTAIQGSTAGFLTLYPDGVRPLASNVNFAAGQVIPNLATVRLAADGSVQIYNGGAGPVDVAADVFGWYAAGTPTAAGAYGAVAPYRIIDTRDGFGVPVDPFGVLTVQTVGQGIPLPNVSAVVLNVTVVNPGSAGHADVYPDDSQAPTVSNINFTAGKTMATMVTVQVGSDGMVRIRNYQAGAAHYVVDIAGYYVTGTPTQAGAFVPVVPQRAMDTRSGHGSPAGALAPFTDAVVRPSVAGLPAVGVQAVAISLTAVSPAAPGVLMARPGVAVPPQTSNVNFLAREDIANAAIVRTGPDGTLAVRNHSTGATQLVSDVFGYFLA